MSSHKLIAVIITCATSVKKNEERREGGQWAEKSPHTFDLNEAGYE